MVDTGARRSTSNGNAAGSAKDRRARKRWLLETFGDGETAVCRRCWTVVLTFTTLTVGRIIAGVDGGTYRRGNIQPECAHCNYSHGSRIGLEQKRAKRALSHGPMAGA